MSSAITVVLAGNPNCGKTAIFNALTGAHQCVGNWPGVTVEKKEGFFRCQNVAISVVDLPGVYSTTVSSEAGAIDEKIACEYLLSDQANVIVNVIDASNLERNLYLTLQLLEMNLPVILAVNMMDVIKARGIHIDLNRLSKRLGCPVVGLIARQKKGIDTLKNLIIQTVQKPHRTTFRLPLTESIRVAAERITHLIPSQHAEWLSLRLLEGDSMAHQQVNESVLIRVNQEIRTVEDELQEEVDILIADTRYSLASEITEHVTHLTYTLKQTLTQKIDKLVLNRYLGIPIFLGVIYSMFLFAINVGGAFQDFFDISSNALFVDGISEVLTKWHSPPWLIAVLANGLGKGINTTITFTPVIGAMFLFLTFLEDSGYMARAAFVMDRFMQLLGLPGKSFVPLIVGLGCNVPAVMGARTLENRRDRILTVMMTPFMSCGARLAIFAVFASSFFPHGGALMIFILYLIGITMAVLTGLLLRKTVLIGNPAPLVMELPPYHIPHFTSVWRHMWQRLKSFLFGAGRFIVPICLFIGVLNSVTVHGKLIQEGDSRSVLSTTGRAITPLFKPMGIQSENWAATVGLATGVLAKEVVVGTLNTLYSQQIHSHSAEHSFNLARSLREAIASIPDNLKQLGDAFKNPLLASEAPHDMNPTAYGVMYHQFSSKSAAFAYLLFVLLYFPCASTLAAMRREIGNRWAWFSVGWSTLLAYALSVIAYQITLLSFNPLTSFIWIATMCLSVMLVVLGLRAYAKSEGLIKGPTQTANYRG